MATTNPNGLIRLEQLQDGEEIRALIGKLTELLNLVETHEELTSGTKYRKVCNPIREEDLTIALQEKLNGLTKFDAKHIWRAIDELVKEKLSLTDLQNYRSKYEKINASDLSSTLRKRLGLKACCSCDSCSGDCDCGCCGDEDGGQYDEAFVNDIINAVREQLEELLVNSFDAFRRKDVAITEQDLDEDLGNKVNAPMIAIGDVSLLNENLIKDAGGSDLVTIVNYLYNRIKDGAIIDPNPKPDEEVLDYGLVTVPLDPSLSEDWGHVSLGIDLTKSQDWNE